MQEVFEKIIGKLEYLRGQAKKDMRHMVAEHMQENMTLKGRCDCMAATSGTVQRREV